MGIVVNNLMISNWLKSWKMTRLLSFTAHQHKHLVVHRKTTLTKLQANKAASSCSQPKKNVNTKCFWLHCRLARHVLQCNAQQEGSISIKIMSCVEIKSEITFQPLWTSGQKHQHHQTYQVFPKSNKMKKFQLQIHFHIQQFRSYQIQLHMCQKMAD